MENDAAMVPVFQSSAFLSDPCSSSKQARPTHCTCHTPYLYCTLPLLTQDGFEPVWTDTSDGLHVWLRMWSLEKEQHYSQSLSDLKGVSQQVNTLGELEIM